MRWIRNFTTILILVWVGGACLKQPEYSATPSISFSDFYYGYKPSSGNKNAVDSIVLTLNFADGDGDLGLETSDSIPPYWGNYYFYTQGGQLYTTDKPNVSDQGVQYVNYHTKRTDPTFTVPDLTVPGGATSVPLPDFVPPYNCFNWEPKTIKGIVVDTIYKQENPYHNNMFVDFYIKDINGTFSKFDLSAYNNYPICSPQYFYAGRMPILSLDLGKKSALTGQIHYSIVSPTGNLKTFFSAKTLKIRFYIVDRALHQSNIVDSPEFTLISITK